MNFLYVLMHQNEQAAGLILRYDKTIEKVMLIHPELLPFGKLSNRKLLSTWWEQRGIPKERHNLQEILSRYQCSSAAMLMVKNLALSLTDTYWVRPESMTALTWEKISLFHSAEENITFHSPEGEEFTRKPVGTLNGSLEKHAVRRKDGWYLQKESETTDGQQCVNEAVACMIHESQNWKEYTQYQLHLNEDGACDYCECRYFTDQDHELVTAFELVNMMRQDNALSAYEQIINAAASMGLDRDYVRGFMDYQILTDFVLTNTDRHLYNFGLLRNPSTMKAICMAPIYDTGNSMFYDDPFSALKRETILKRDITALRNREEKMLDLVSNRFAVKASLLPSPEEILAKYDECGINAEKAELIAKGYSFKLQMLQEYQEGKSISFYHEKHGH